MTHSSRHSDPMGQLGHGESKESQTMVERQEVYLGTVEGPSIQNR